MNRLAGGPMFNTDITVGKSGREVRNANWQDALWRFNAAYAVKTRADVATLEAFFLTCYGRETAFLLQAANDYKIPHSGSTPQTISAITATTYQISKKYTDALSNVYTRTITRPSATTSDLAVYDNGVLKTHTTHYTYSTTTGIISFTYTPTTPVTITLAKFYVPVRFDIDVLDTDTLLWYVSSGTDVSHHQLPDIPMIEVRED